VCVNTWALGEVVEDFSGAYVMPFGRGQQVGRVINEICTAEEVSERWCDRNAGSPPKTGFIHSCFGSVLGGPKEFNTKDQLLPYWR